jgi:hypothetical protein
MKFKIHPAIGIARVGDSPDDFYLAPEQVGHLPLELTSDGKEQPITTFKDAQQRVKRQAARFRVFGYEDGSKDGKELEVGAKIEVVSQRNGQLLKGEVLDIEWTVYLANKKASWYEFKQLDGEHGYDENHRLRNADVTAPDARQQLIIDPGPQTVSYVDEKQRTAEFAKGKNPGYSQSFPPPLNPASIETLGELRAIQQDKHVRLLVFGGFGNSGSFKKGFGDPVIKNYANNDGWFDDTSDGPVTARVKFKVLEIDGRVVDPKAAPRTAYATVEVPAWVIVGYPRFAPQITDIVTMDEVVYDVAVQNFCYEPYMYGTAPFSGTQVVPDSADEKAIGLWRETAQWNPDYYPYFYRDIWPILTRPNDYQFVMDFNPFTGGDPHNTTSGAGGNLDESVISIPPYDGEDPQEQKSRQRARMFVWGVLRKPGQENLWNYPFDSNTPTYLPILMPFLCGDNPLSNTVPSKFLRLTDTQLFILGQWARGKFINEKLEGMSDGDSGAAAPSGTDIDRGVLSNLLGGSFCPGGEATWIVRNPAIYGEPYRIKHSSYFTSQNLQSWNPQPLSLPVTLPVIVGATDAGSLNVGLEPGDITKYSGVPWQADFNECSTQPIHITYEKWNLIYPQSTGDPLTDITQTTFWWPSHRPMEVMIPSGAQVSWSQGVPNNHAGDLKMVTAWKELGFIKDNPDWTPTNGTPKYIQVERNSET